VVLPLIDDFLSIVLKNCSLIDVRAPIEFAKGAFPNTINLPIMSNEERHLIGIRYKNNGNQAAVALGKELIDGSPRKERTEKWKAFVKANPDAYLYCFRGGQRSRITQEWLADEGVNITRLKGGYKAFRNFLMSASEEIAKKSNTIIIGGRTGSGKTLLLDELENSIDLEKLANHRGSSFGSFISAQPAQIDFENSLAYALINHDAKGYNYLIIEHEGRNIGCINIPKNLFDPLQENASLIILETPMQERVDIIYKEYVTDSLLSYHESFEEEGKKR
jgi:tRNA 2-selenouridine synthase